MTAHHDIGKLGESLAERFLVERGYRLIERNARVDGDELDLIMALGPMIVAVEVKTTTNGADPFEAIDDGKLRRVHRAADGYRLHVARVDAIAIMIDHLGSTVHWVQSM